MDQWEVEGFQRLFSEKVFSSIYTVKGSVIIASSIEVAVPKIYTLCMACSRADGEEFLCHGTTTFFASFFAKKNKHGRWQTNLFVKLQHLQIFYCVCGLPLEWCWQIFIVLRIKLFCKVFCKKLHWTIFWVKNYKKPLSDL